MPARTKNRAKFNFRGRPFLWWIDGDKYLRILSQDKKFIVAHPIATDGPSIIEVIGHEFPGISPSAPRPIRLLAPEWAPITSMGALVDSILRWCHDPTHTLTRFDGPLRFL